MNVKNARLNKIRSEKYGDNYKKLIKLITKNIKVASKNGDSQINVYTLLGEYANIPKELIKTALGYFEAKGFSIVETSGYDYYIKW